MPSGHWQCLASVQMTKYCFFRVVIQLPVDITSRLYPWQWAATKDGNRNLNQAHRCNRTGLGSVVNKIIQASTGQLSNSPPSQQKENAMISEVKDYMFIFSEELLTAKIYGCRSKLPEWSQKLLFTPLLSINKECIESILILKKDKLLEIYQGSH